MPTSAKAAKTFNTPFAKARPFPLASFARMMPIIFIGTAIKPSAKDAFVSTPYVPSATCALINNNKSCIRNIKIKKSEINKNG
jgi:hypothetical protein